MIINHQGLGRFYSWSTINYTSFLCKLCKHSSAFRMTPWLLPFATARCNAHPVEMAASELESWIGLSSQYIMSFHGVNCQFILCVGVKFLQTPMDSNFADTEPLIVWDQWASTRGAWGVSYRLPITLLFYLYIKYKYKFNTIIFKKIQQKEQWEMLPGSP